MGSLRIEILLKARAPIGRPSCGLHFFDRMNNLIFAVGNCQLGIDVSPMRSGATVLFTFTVIMSVQPGPYTFNIAVGEQAVVDTNEGLFYDVCEGLGPIEVHPPSGVWPFYGIANLPTRIEVSYV